MSCSSSVLVLLFLVPFTLAATGGKIVGYLPGYKPTSINPSDLAAAGYTHVIVAFATFNSTHPGTLVNSFPYITSSHVKKLQAAGLKVLISLGGADATDPGTTVDFHQIMTGCGSNFTALFTSEIEKMVATYGFDGVDFDIETGFSLGPSPNDADVLADVIKLLYKHNPNLILSLVPQAENIAPSQTQGMWLSIYGSYSYLALKTASEIAWTGVQIYNTGGMNGINDQLYANMDAKDLDFSVAMAVDMLESWPDKTPDGRPTGFAPYKGILRDDQVLLGYPAPNSKGNSDGGPNKPNTVIKQIIKCLRGGYSDHSVCTSYYPPNRDYPNFGGVFEWELTYDQDNQFKFASELKDCVIDGVC
jgi:chitinase